MGYTLKDTLRGTHPGAHTQVHMLKDMLRGTHSGIHRGPMHTYMGTHT